MTRHWFSLLFMLCTCFIILIAPWLGSNIPTVHHGLIHLCTWTELQNKTRSCSLCKTKKHPYLTGRAPFDAFAYREHGVISELSLDTFDISALLPRGRCCCSCITYVNDTARARSRTPRSLSRVLLTESDIISVRDRCRSHCQCWRHKCRATRQNFTFRMR